MKRYIQISSAAFLGCLAITLLLRETTLGPLVWFFMLPGVVMATALTSVIGEWSFLFIAVASAVNGLLYGFLLNLLLIRASAGDQPAETAVSVEGLHRGPLIHRIAPVAGVGGLIFTVGAMVIFLTLPHVRWFFGASLLAGGLVGLVLWWRHR